MLVQLRVSCAVLDGESKVLGESLDEVVAS